MFSAVLCLPQLSSCAQVVLLTWLSNVFTHTARSYSEKSHQHSAAAACTRQHPATVPPANVLNNSGCCLWTPRSFSSSKYQNTDRVLHSAPCHSLMPVPKTSLPIPRGKISLNCSLSFFFNPCLEAQTFSPWNQLRSWYQYILFIIIFIPSCPASFISPCTYTRPLTDISSRYC